MPVTIIGSESLGVRGMCCLVTAGRRRILIDPGIALGYRRHGLLPHPCQVAAGIKIRREIIKTLATATDIVFSHYHGDHVPLLQANPYQLSLMQLPDHCREIHVWGKSPENLPSRMQQRAADLEAWLGKKIAIAEGSAAGPLHFSGPVPHGLAADIFGSVMMTRIDLPDQVFVHASDIQLVDAATVEKILAWKPDIVFVSGPPLYLQKLDKTARRLAWENALRLAKNVKTLIVDHHLLRVSTGLIWLDRASQASGKKVFCAAEFMNRPLRLLEARRSELYEQMPVPENWHQHYEKGIITMDQVLNFTAGCIPE